MSGRMRKLPAPRIVPFDPDLAGWTAGISGWSSALGLTKNSIAEDANSIDLKLDVVPMFEETTELQATAVADATGAEELAGANGLVLRNVGENFLERKQHIPRGSCSACLAIDANFHSEFPRIPDLVRRDQPRTDRVGAVEALALGRAQTAPRLDRLPVPCGKVVEDRVAEYMGACFGDGDIGRRALGDEAEFKLVIDDLAVARPIDCGPGRRR